MTRTRAYRRKALAKAKKKCKNRILWWDPEVDVNHFYRNRKPCSCYMCGNPRKYYGDVTLQERRAAIDEMEQRESAHE